VKVLAVAGEKGGTGKTTIAVNLAVEALSDGLKVLLIDADTQRSAFMFHETSAESGYPLFQTVMKPSRTLHKEVRGFDSFDVVFIDAGGRDSSVFRSAIIAADNVIIPIQPGQFDLWSLSHVLDLIDEARDFKEIDAKVVINMVTPRARVVKDAIDALREEGIPFFNTMLGLRVAYREASAAGAGVTEFSKNSKAAKELKALWKEVKTWIGVR